MDQKLAQIKEYVRIVKDAPYALKTYLTTYDNTQKKYVPLDLFPDQIQLIKDYESYNENITKKYRQAGVTTVTAAWISRRLQIAKPENPERVLIIANKRDTAIEMANKIRHFIDQWPEWINVGFSVDKNSESRFRLNNGCEVKAVATSADALRGYTPTILIFDEAAYIEAGDDFWAASMASLSCVHEESYIFTDNGILQLKDIISEKKNIGFTKYDGDIKVINKDKKIVNIKNTFKSEKSTCYNIKTKLGYELIGSFKHPLLVNTTTDNDEWVWMENMKVGDKIKFQFDQNLFGKDQDIKFDLKHFNEKEKYNLPLKLSDDLDLCYLMGLFIAEGNYNDNTIAITNGDDEIINFLLNMGFVKSRKHHFYYTSSYLKRFFQEYIGILKSKAKDKKIPSIILRSSKNVVKTFLQGMFDGDGCAFKNGVKYTSTSKELISQLQILLLNFGVQSYVKYTEQKTSQTSILTNKNHITKIYNLFIKNQYIERFFNEIGFRLTRKQIKQDSYKNKIKNSQTIYATKDELKTILRENGIKRSQYEKEFRFMDGLLRRNKTKISLHSIERLFENNLPNKTTLSVWENRYENLKSYFYDEIIKIDSFEDDTYDLEIPDGHSFVSNGIISHNTGGKIILISCVTKDTYVFTNNGLEQVSNYIHTESPVGVGYFTEDYEIRGKDNVRKSNILLNNGKQKTKKITTLHSSIEGTHTHKVWSFSKTKNEYGWNCFSELSVGDYINVGFNFNMWGNNDKINYVYEPSSKENNIFFTNEITNEIAYFLGLFLAEGSIYQKFNDNGNLIGSNITITCGDDISELLLKLKLKYYQKDGVHYNISSKSLSNFLKELGFDFNLKAKNKIIPKKLLSLSKEKTKFLLQGLFDGDGFSDKNRLRIGIGLSSKEMINQIRMLLLNFGILTDYYEVNTKPTKKVKAYSMNYRISAIGKNADSFYNEIGFGFERKNKKRIKYNSRKDSFDIIPNGSKILLDIIDKHKIFRKNITKGNLGVWDQLKKVENLSRKSFEELFSEISKLTNSIDENYIYDKILINNSKWDKIKLIEDCENETFDFSLYDNPNDFWCHSIYYNGYLGHQTPNGFDPIYHGVYDQSIRGMNDFHITDLRWFKDPRYSKDLRWVKCIDICHYMLNREEYNDDEIILYDFDPEKYNEYLELGYKPFSSWFESMSKKFKYDRRKISQELEADFLGSGDGVIPGSIQENISKNFVREPKEKYMQGTFWQWKEPVQGHRYLMGCLPPNEKVLTDSGLKNIQEVLITDKLISENGDYVNIINKQIYSVIEEDTFEVSVDNTFRTTTFTKEHPILISKPILKRNYDKTNKTYRFNERYWDFDFNYVKMENVTVGDWIKVPNIYKKEIIGILEDKWIKTEGIRKDFVIDSPLKNKEFWWFIGMWLGDGWLGKLNNSHTISICFNSKDEYYLNKTNELIIRLFDRSPSFIDRGRNTFELVFNSKFLYNFIIKNFGQYSFGKKISEWVKFIPNELKIELLKGYLASDGCWLKTEKNGKINSKISFVSINLELLESIQDIIFSLGIVSSLNKLRNSKKSYINGRLVQQKETYNLCLANNDSLELIKLLNNDSLDTKLNKFNINDFSIINNRPISSCHLSKDRDFIFFKIKSVKKSKFTGNVYNFECDTHTFMCHHITTHNCDVSRGDSEDFSSINIIDFDEREQVAEYIGKMPPDDLATVCYKWGILYEAFIVIDITGGMGIATSRKLQEMNYKNLYIDGVNTQNIWDYNRKALEKIPGLNFNNKRTQIVSAFEEQLRKGFIVRSSRLLNELSTFVYINGRPDHMKGYHDDSIMSLSMALYAADMCFNQLEKNQNANKAMLESWTISERTYETTKSFYSYGVAFDTIGSMNMGDPENNYFINTPNKDQYKEYSWLFSKRKK